MCEAGVSQSMYLGPTVAAPRTYKFLNSWINCIRNPGGEAHQYWTILPSVSGVKATGYTGAFYLGTVSSI